MAVKVQYGGLTKVYFGILTANQTEADPIVPPPDVLATTSGEATAGSTSIAVTATGDEIAAGNLLKFYPSGQVVTVTVNNLSGEAVGAASITIDALASDLPKGAKLYGVDREFPVELSAAASASATTLSIASLKEALADGESLYYFSGSPKYAYTTVDADSGSTSLTVEPLDETIASGSIALHKGLILMEGGTSTGESITTDSEQIFTFGNSRGYSVSSPTGASWELPYESLVLPLESSFYRLAYAAKNAVGGILGYVRKRDPAPNGYVYGQTVEGYCAVYGYEKTNPADGNVTFSVTFTGQEEPTVTPPQLS